MMSPTYHGNGVHFCCVDGRIMIHTEFPVRCGICRAGHFLFNMVEGRTICIGCVTDRDKEARYETNVLH